MEWSTLALARTKVDRGEQYGREKTTTGGRGGWVHGRLNNGGGSAQQRSFFTRPQIAIIARMVIQ